MTAQHEFSAAPGERRDLSPPSGGEGNARRSPRRYFAVAVLVGLLVAVGLWMRPQLSAWYHFREARSALRRYHSRQAIQHLRLCLQTWPNDAEVLFLAARIARRTGNYAEAEIALNKYEAQRGSDDSAALERTLLRAESGDMDRTSGFCKHWIEHEHPDAPFIFEAMIRGYLHAYRLADARRMLHNWRQTQPDNPQSYFVEGEIHDCEVLASEAIACYQQVLQLDPEHEEARLKLTAALLEQRAFAEAAPHLEYLRQRQPDNLLVLVRLAACHDFQGQREEAVQLLEHVLSGQPDFAPALAERGKIALAQEEYAAAEDWLRLAVQRNPSDQPARYSLVQCLRRSGKETEAQEQEQRLRRLESDLKRIGKIATQEMPTTPHNAALHCELGVIFLRIGLAEPGLHWLNSALQQDSRCLRAHQALADYYQRIGNAEKAEFHRRIAPNEAKSIEKPPARSVSGAVHADASGWLRKRLLSRAVGWVPSRRARRKRGAFPEHDSESAARAPC